MKSGLSIPTAFIALSVMVLWGLSFIAIEIGLREVSPWQMVLLRYLPAAAIFAVMLLVKAIRGQLHFTLRMTLELLIAGLFMVSLYNLSLNTGLSMLPASLGALVIALNPAMITIVAMLFLRERPRPRTWIGLVLALAGLVFVVFARYGTPELRAQNLLGMVITLGAPLSIGLYTSVIRNTAPKLGAVGATVSAITVGSLPLVFFIGPELLQVVSTMSSELFWSLMFLSLGCTVYGFVMWGYVLKRVEASTAGMFIYLVPLIAALGSYFMLDEPLDLPLLLGGTITVIGVAISTGLATRIWQTIRRA
ncbi:DMT family transporter [bacterium]|nr:DMT family transporter [bacterium]